MATVYKLNLVKMTDWELKDKPNMEKNIIKPVETCTTLLLPIRVRPRRPTFSLYYMIKMYNTSSIVDILI